jgi:hypothetical protein
MASLVFPSPMSTEQTTAVHIAARPGLAWARGHGWEWVRCQRVSLSSCALITDVDTDAASTRAGLAVVPLRGDSQRRP